VKLVSPESLSPDQSLLLKEYSRSFPQGAVCVNVMVGSEPWDIRPLLLIGGKVSLARFSMELGEARAKRVAAELEGYSVLFNNQQRIVYIAGEGRFMLLRPFANTTLRDDLEKGEIVGDRALTLIVRDLIKIVSDLSRRSLAHGHISPSNITREGGRIQLIDPVMGYLHRTEDTYLPPESERGELPGPASDLYGLGCMIRILLGDRLTQRQQRLVEQLLLPSARQRPPLVEVAIAFGVRDADVVEERGEQRIGSERVVRQGARVSAGDGEYERGADRRDDYGRQGELDNGSYRQSRRSSLGSNLILLGLLALGAGWVIYQRYPELYYRAAAYLPALAPSYSPEYEDAWVSGERARMSVVARAAAVRGEPAAINTVLDDVLTGSNPEGVRGAFMRVAFDEEWRSELSEADRKTALALGLDQLVPELKGRLDSVTGLHPGILLAILGQLQSKNVTNEIRQVQIDRLLALPEPFRGLFGQMKSMGAKTLGDPRVAALAGIVTGDTRVANLESFIGKDCTAAQTLASISLIAPIIANNQGAQRDLLGILTERGGELGSLVSWFEILDLAQWSKVAPEQKLALVLGELPEQGLASIQYVDLLSFPIESVRSKSILKVRGSFQDTDAEKVLVTVTSPASGLTREQVIALISALQLAPEARTPFITAWFDLKPPPDTVLLLLLARASADSTDLFNLEATRYLKRSEFNYNLDVLKLLAVHPEPLARVLAYTKLDPNEQAQRSVLLERKLHEKEPACLQVLEGRVPAK
jgi:hypothetical protein